MPRHIVTQKKKQSLLEIDIITSCHCAMEFIDMSSSRTLLRASAISRVDPACVIEQKLTASVGGKTSELLSVMIQYQQMH